MARTRFTGICGSESKQVFMDFGEGNTDSPLSGTSSPSPPSWATRSWPRWPNSARARGLEVGQRVVLNPWLSCGPRGIDPPCPVVRGRRLQPVLALHRGRAGRRHPHRDVQGRTGGFADYFPAHDSMFIPVPDAVPDEVAVFADPFAVSLHSVTRHPPPPGGRALVYGAGALGTTATAILRALYPDVEVMVVARFEAQAALARRLGATVVAPEPREQLIEEAAAWSGGVLRPVRKGLPMAHPGGFDVVYDTIGKPETFEVGVRLLKARGTLVKSGVHAPVAGSTHRCTSRRSAGWGRTRSGSRRSTGCASTGSPTTWTLVEQGRVDLTGMLTHTFRLDQWREAFSVLATQERSGAIKVAFDFR